MITLLSRDTVLRAQQGTVNFRICIGGVWQTRGTTSTVVKMFWIKTLSTDPDPPSGGGYAIAGDVILSV